MLGAFRWNWIVRWFSKISGLGFKGLGSWVSMALDLGFKGIGSWL
jgi:hypothetical protein